jgi:TonB-dependent SusC/RagA subfamily outer membrane receptor
MKSDTKVLDEVVVTAQGLNRKQKALGYSTQKVAGEDLTISRQTDLGNAMAGKVSGARFIGGASSGFDAGTIILRGAGSIPSSSQSDNPANEPIYVVDGAITNKNSINMDDVESINVLKGPAATALYGSRGGGNYWKELLDRIRDIRSSEKVLYRQVLDIYATSVDYDPRTDASKLFFKIVQNKLHYAAHGHTAAEVIYERADADKPFMGLTTFEGELPAIKDIKIAKNYLKENELKILNNLVSGYFDFAEIMAMEHRPVYMMDYVKQLDTILQSTGRPLLKGSGSISHEEAMDKAIAEYRKYQVKVLTPVEEAYLESINALGKIAKRKGRQSGENH